MNRLVSVLANRRFVRWVPVPHLAFFAIPWCIQAKDLIGVLNPIDLALGVAFHARHGRLPRACHAVVFVF